MGWFLLRQLDEKSLSCSISSKNNLVSIVCCSFRKMLFIFIYTLKLVKTKSLGIDKKSVLADVIVWYPFVILFFAFYIFIFYAVYN